MALDGGSSSLLTQILLTRILSVNPWSIPQAALECDATLRIMTLTMLLDA